MTGPRRLVLRSRGAADQRRVWGVQVPSRGDGVGAGARPSHQHILGALFTPGRVTNTSQRRGRGLGPGEGGGGPE